ncbi:F-box protein At4g35930 isoform X2 [Brassica rapa]|uniref:F-box protein At4g35930 isoform X2 n=1 Tax=Brassica campestris TaxID=3711 RepID=UPI00142D5268|nr:F-box protein At4g35930 isoform X2 [Brassica rapa]
MGKVSPKDSDSKISTRKKKLKSSNNKYLKPGALVQLCYSKASATAKSNNDLGKKRVPVFDSKPARSNVIAVEDVESSKKSPLMLSPVGIVMQNSLLRTPKTPPQAEPCDSESQFESLPMDLLVKIVCHLHHDQLKAVFHVSQRIRAAAVIARQYHFNYTTPDRSRQEMLSVLTPMPINRWPFVSKGDENYRIMGSPHTPKAPRHAPRPPCRTKLAEMKQITAVLFQDQTAFPSRCSVPSVLQRPTLFKPLAPKHPRVLFYEDELCQAVAQNNLQ